MSSNFKTKQFKKLQKHWYGRLAKEGFDDIERNDNSNLKTDALTNVLHLYSVDQFNIKEDYYRLAGQFLHEHKFDSDLERTIWYMHSEGISVVNIIKSLKAKKQVAYKDLIHGIVKKLANEMKLKVKK